MDRSWSAQAFKHGKTCNQKTRSVDIHEYAHKVDRIIDRGSVSNGSSHWDHVAVGNDTMYTNANSKR